MPIREFVREKRSKIKDSIKAFYSGMNKPLSIINTCTIVLFVLLIFSIPALSFKSGFHYITWGLTIAVVGLMALSFFFGNKFKVDCINIMFVAFIISSFISCALTKFATINITYFLLTLFLTLTYTYSKADVKVKNVLLAAIYIASIIFLAYYILTYREKLFSFGGVRLGDKFGDINDISIFNGLGFSFSLYYVFFSKKFYKIFHGVLLALFTLAILSSGSKIAYLFIPVVLFTCVALKLGKKRWWITLLIIIGTIGLFVLVLQIPVFDSIRIRILSMINSIFKINTSEPIRKDFSTSNRLTMFVIGMDLFLRRPLFGYGVNGFQYFGGYSDGMGWSHNHFSEMLSGTGIIGFMLYNLPIFYSLYSAVKTKKKLPAVLLIFFVITMISIALPGEKLFAYPIGVIISAAYTPSDVTSFGIDIRKLFKSKETLAND